jgi:DNA-binding CsgD family transcriptional regulator
VEPVDGPAPRRVAVVAADALTRQALGAAVEQVADARVVAWAEDVELLIVLGARVDVCVCAEPPGNRAASRLRERGAALVVPAPDADPADVVRAELARKAPEVGRRPRLAPRQREVLVAYVAGSDLLPTVARELGMDRETLKTHLRRIRAKYAEVGRPAPTRRDLYVRAVEDGLIPPPAEGGHHHSGGST